MRLDERLQQLIAADAAALPRDALPAPTTPGVDRRSRRPRRLEVLASGIGGLGVAAAATTLLTGSSAAGLPVLRTPTTDGRGVTAGLDLGKPIDFSHAHVVRTDEGEAAVVTIDDGTHTCLAIPDSQGDDGAMGGCRDTGAVEREGFLVQSIPVQLAGTPAPRGSMAFILPVGASNARIFNGVEDRAVSVASGIALAYTHGAGRLRYELGGHTIAVPLAGPFPDGKGVCPDGYEYVPKIVPGSDANGAPGYLNVRTLCTGHDGDERHPDHAAASGD